MNVCAVLIVRNEADIIGHAIEHLRSQVDHVIAVDNASTDTTAEAIRAADAEYQHDPDPAFDHEQKLNHWVRYALAEGFDWIIPADADEFPYAPGGERVADFLARVPTEFDAVAVPMFDQIVTPRDSGEANPARRMRWRKRVQSGRKIVCRLRPGLVIGNGYHQAHIDGEWIRETTGLALRHFPYRSFDQYRRKVRDGVVALDRTSLPIGISSHWRRAAAMADDELDAYCRSLYRSDQPWRDRRVIYDPAPIAGNPSTGQFGLFAQRAAKRFVR